MTAQIELVTEVSDEAPDHRRTHCDIRQSGLDGGTAALIAVDRPRELVDAVFSGQVRSASAHLE